MSVDKALLIIEEDILPEHVQEIVSKALNYHSENIEKFLTHLEM
jgi:hypothetical protein